MQPAKSFHEGFSWQTNRCRRKSFLQEAFKSEMSAEMLVFDDFRNSAHGAFLYAFTATDAGVFGHNFGNTGGDIKNFLRASINANAATDAIVFDDDRTGHWLLLL